MVRDVTKKIYLKRIMGWALLIFMLVMIGYLVATVLYPFVLVFSFLFTV